MATIDSQSPARASHVYLFKNGYGMVVKKFEFPPNKDNDNKSLELIDVPSNPVHGTFWIQPINDKVSITSIRTKKTHKTVDEECATVEDLLEANKGATVDLLTTDLTSKSNEWISGKIVSVKGTRQDADDEAPVTNAHPTPFQPHMSSLFCPGESGNHVSASSRCTGTSAFGHAPLTSAGNLVLVETASNGFMALPLSSVHSLRGPTLKTTYGRKVSTNCLSIEYRHTSDVNEMGLMKYLTFGITWVPSYNLILSSSTESSTKTLRLLSKAVILNDTENMQVENLSCIVGFPNVSQFASIVDPMISDEDVRVFLDHLAQCEADYGRSMHSHPSSIMSNSVMTQQIMSPSAFLSAPPNHDHIAQDSKTEDLHLYEFKNVLLSKKERLMLPIFDIDIPYKDVYNCKIETPQSGYVHAGYDERKPSEEVWHSVEFENISNFVWTTAPVVITKGLEEQQFIGQDKMTYTSKGSTTFVNLTKALDVRVQLDEKVLNAPPTRLTLFRTNYQTDQIEGKIVVMNYKPEEVVVVLNLSLMGKMSNYSVAPKKDSVKVNENVANQQHDIQWEVNVKPKQTLEIRYVRSFNRRV